MLNNDTNAIVDRILREKLNPFKVPVEIRNSIAEEIIAIFARPERQKRGVTFMTPEASLAADRARERKKAMPTDNKPEVI